MTHPVLSECCNAATEMISYHIMKLAGSEIMDTGYRCLNCGHKFYIRTTDKTNKLAPGILEVVNCPK
ncbi:MAG: hypothetical protein WC455_27700 [Dehalococcoidia bacterium]